jgi:hypothetical protein
MEATPRPFLVCVEYGDGYDTLVRANTHRLIFKWSQRDRALLRLFRTIQFKRLAESHKFKRSDLPIELEDPDPYEPEYVFFCLRLKGCSV